MSDDLHMRDNSSNNLQNPERYAINPLGQQALRSTNALVNVRNPVEYYENVIQLRDAIKHISDEELFENDKL